MKHHKRAPLSRLESTVMQIVWQGQGVTAEDVRTRLADGWPLKDSTVRTVLRRLENKGYVKHTTQGRTYVYSPNVAPRRVAADTIRSVVDRFCDGSVENLLVGMIDDELIQPETLRKLAERIARAEGNKKRKR